MADIPAELTCSRIDCDYHCIFYKLYWRQLSLGKATETNAGAWHSDDAVGVVQTLTLVEHSVEWTKYSRFWSDKTRTIRDATNVVPFALDCHGHGVSVADPTLAHGLDESLSVIYHHYDSRQSSVGEHVMDWLSGSKTKGLEETERMLLEGTRVTAVGEIAIDGDVVVRPPSCGALYIVTTLSHSELMRSFEGKSRWFRFFAVAAGVVGVGLAVVVAERSYRAWRIRSDARRNRERAEERRRHLAAGSVERQERRAAALEPCVVCMENPRECVMLECGHICLCYDCVEQLPTMHCPVCRADVSRIVPTFLS
ncbi:PREDICTED: mitochondrial ubiquitin ligase activator of nfkb 1-A-like [Priapulus caudatus]|uniref:RING-type E3 ubiquitin transferase n=1 Tax=Priapulus caudatus TaxID=37621 RepID=A0ABM1EJ51_PRICU|nr:PREDICTED: mitochondrial ubiquitin ligase activator of nfkb 1-A-like [Priapulus caudatus]